MRGIVLRSFRYLLYSSTISCSDTGIWMSSRSGRLRTKPLRSLGSTSSHWGIWPRPALRLSSTRGACLEFGRSCTTSPTLTRNDGTETLRPFTARWPWATICRPSRREAAKPRRWTTLSRRSSSSFRRFSPVTPLSRSAQWKYFRRSEEHTSELQSQSNLVCRLLLEKKKNLSRTTTLQRTPRWRAAAVPRVCGVCACALGEHSCVFRGLCEDLYTHR